MLSYTRVNRGRKLPSGVVQASIRLLFFTLQQILYCQKKRPEASIIWSAFPLHCWVQRHALTCKRQILSTNISNQTQIYESYASLVQLLCNFSCNRVQTHFQLIAAWQFFSSILPLLKWYSRYCTPLVLGLYYVACMDEGKDETVARVQRTPLLCSTRLGISILCFVMFFHMFAQRVGMAVAIVSMVNQTAVSMMAAGMCNSVFDIQHFTKNADYKRTCNRK